VGLSVVLDVSSGQAHVAIDTGTAQHTAAVNWPGDAAQVRERAAVAALGLAFRVLGEGEDA
ncbi:MAG: competence/damage-inducible protein A, partial [Deinococcus sp.]|nr:competence/damage-inducible protein A [Deinococcus sp.]